MAIRSHNEQTRLHLMYVFQEYLGRRRFGSTGIRLGHNMMAVQEGHSTLDAALCLLLLGINTHDVHLPGVLQPEHLEHLQGTSRVQAPVIRHDHYPPLRQGAGDSDNRARALFEHHLESIVGLLLRFKVKKGVLTEHDEVVALGLKEDLRSRGTRILEHLAGDICPGTALRTAL